MKKVLFVVLMLFSMAATAHYQDYRIHPDDVNRVYDGDTIFVNLRSVPPLFGSDLGVRFNEIDTPEIRSRCKDPVAKAREKRLALQARDIVSEQIDNATSIILTNVQPGAFGRIRADVIVDGVNVSDALVAAGLAVPYEGSEEIWCKDREVSVDQ